MSGLRTIGIAWLAVAAAAAESAPRRGIALAVGFDRQAASSLVAEIQRELSTILDPLDLDANWHSLEDSHGRTFDSRLIVVRFLGACEASPASHAPDRGALGATHAIDGNVLPFIDIHCDRVRAFLGGDLKSTLGTLYLARALARVLSHEVYHVLSGTGDHGRAGVAKPALTSAELTRGTLRFDSQTTVRLVRRLLRRR